jgi:hypothetical protein
MAGDWIKWEKGLAWKPEVGQMAQRLGMTRAEIVLGLMLVWEWADSNVTSSDDDDRNAPSVTIVAQDVTLVDELSRITGLGNAMLEVHWLLEREGGFAFPRYGRHNGNPAKTRALAKDRQKKARNAVSVTNVTQTPLPEKRREEIEKKKKIIQTPLPPKGGEVFPGALDTDEFLEAWDRWKTYRTEIKKRLTPTTIRQQLKTLETMGHDDAIRSIDQSIGAGWIGLFPADGRGSTPSAGRGPGQKPTAGAIRSAREFPDDAPLPILNPEGGLDDLHGV